MDNRVTVRDVVWAALSTCESRGPTQALRQLKTRIPAETVQSSEYLQALFDAYKSASTAEKSKMRRAAEDLAGMSIALPRDILFYLGIPKREFGLRVDLLNGRLGDTLGQLAKFVHAMHALNLVVYVKSRLSKHRTVMLCCADSFDEEFGIYDGNEGTLHDYVFDVANDQVFSRTFLTDLSPSLFSRLPSRDSLSFSSDSLVLHVRAGDALFMGALTLPPLSYYQMAISASEAKKVVVVAEPANSQDPCVNPVPGLIQSFCDSSGIECTIQSSEEIEIDAATLFYAKRVVASNSSFSKWLPLYGDFCHSLIIPDSLGGGDNWVQHECITYVDCWDGFELEKWRESLDYRLAWVSADVQSK